MPRCPNCHYEYRAGVQTCPDCRVPLLDAKPEASALSSGTLSFFAVVGTIFVTFFFVFTFVSEWPYRAWVVDMAPSAVLTVVGVVSLAFGYCCGQGRPARPLVIGWMLPFVVIDAIAAWGVVSQGLAELSAEGTIGTAWLLSLTLASLAGVLIGKGYLKKRDWARLANFVLALILLGIYFFIAYHRLAEISHRVFL